ncbi:MAG: TrkA family potassium uptake protein [Puniceicoccales bacterium]|jgi:trk system potassium uptake protein TrkA|nr:TrkA family potassium uptake protein [Puniceicoccales bacterium]
MSMKCCIIGLDLFGQHLARELNQFGAEVLAIGDREDVASKIKDDVADARTVADFSDTSFLEKASVQDFDVVVVSIGDSFERSLTLVIKAKELKARRVIARAISTEHEHLLKLLRVERIVVPEELAAHGLAHSLLMRGVEEGYEMGDGYSIVEARVPGLKDGCLRDKGDVFKRAEVRIVTIKRVRHPLLEKITGRDATGGASDEERKTLGVPSLDEKFQEDDVFVLFGREKKLRAFLEEFGK